MLYRGRIASFLIAVGFSLPIFVGCESGLASGLSSKEPTNLEANFGNSYVESQSSSQQGNESDEELDNLISPNLNELTDYGAETENHLIEEDESRNQLLANIPFDNTHIKRFLSRWRFRPVKAEGFKRGPGFRSWGGKRAKFSNWGGKRARFSNWGGKRSDAESQEEKREIEVMSPFEQYKKRGSSIGKVRPFQSWGGKRANYQKDVYLPDWRKVLSYEGKRKFSSWGGKRSQINSDSFTDGSDVFEKRDDESRRKQSFRSWGGKRSDDDDADLFEIF